MEKESRNARIANLLENAKSGIKNVFTSDKYKEFLKAMTVFHNYSTNNLMLIHLANPKATRVASFQTWKKLGRYVNKGEKGIEIVVPIFSKIKKDKDLDQPESEKSPKDIELEKKLSGFSVGYVFDISQTSGKELPELAHKLEETVENYEVITKALYSISPYPIQFSSNFGEANGLCNFTEGKIEIKEGMSESQTIKTMIHEIAHATVHSMHPDKPNEIKSAETKEVEAESIAYVVTNHLGINSKDYSFPYIAAWSSGLDLPELESSMNTIRKEADIMISKIETELENQKLERTEEMSEIEGELLEREAQLSLVYGNQGRER